MKIIIKIAKAELRNLFYSPIAWFLLIVFLVQCGMAYLNLLDSSARTQEIGGRGLQYMNDLTQRIFLERGGLFSNVMEKLYLYIPLLSMGLISREMGSGTIKLLYSSPISVVEIVLGKYLAMMAYSLLMSTVIGIFMVSGMFNIQSPDGGMLLSGALGFYLLLCAYSAIGLFMSCLSTYQVVAAVSTFVMIGILSYVGTLWQDIDFVRDLTYFLSIAGRTEHMLMGLITSKDLIYFLLIIFIFVAFTILKLQSGMESKGGTIKTARYAGVLIIALLIGYISSRPGLITYYDATANKNQTLTPNAQQIIKELGNEPLEITAYNNLLGNYYYLGLPELRNQNMSRWEPYIRFKSTIKLKYVNYYDSTYEENSYISRQYPGKSLKQVAEQIAKSSDIDLSQFLTPEQIHQKIDLKPELNRFVMQLKWKGHSTFLRIFNDMQVWPSETEVAAAFKRIQQAKLPKIGFVIGDLERDIDKLGDRDYKALTNLPTFRNSLINQGFDVDTVLLEGAAIPADIAALVIADPKIPFSTEAMYKLTQYIDLGGNLLIAGEPGKQDVLNSLLTLLGVKMMAGTLIQESKEFAPNLVTPQLTAAVATFSKRLAQRAADSAQVSMPSAAGLSYTPGSGFQVKPLLLTDAKHSWNRMKPLNLDEVTSASTGSIPMGGGMGRRTFARAAGTATFSAADGDVKGSIPVMLSLSRTVNRKEQRIIIAGDADFMSNTELQRNNMRTANFELSTGIFSWLTGGQFPIDTSRPESKDKRVNVSTDDVAHLKIIYLWVLPGLLLAVGAILLIRRKRK
ncbi:ABC-2 type transport system permease protein [bacterium A37T11]|nr:ABC-2 type transport system permease protein [bacterium A37T11]